VARPAGGVPLWGCQRVSVSERAALPYRSLYAERARLVRSDVGAKTSRAQRFAKAAGVTGGGGFGWAVCWRGDRAGRVNAEDSAVQRASALRAHDVRGWTGKFHHAPLRETERDFARQFMGKTETERNKLGHSMG
jgi:hypothetical protein